MPTWYLYLTQQARRALDKLPVKDRRLVDATLAAMREDPYFGDVVRLRATQPAAYRRRVGAYRIFFDLDSNTLLIAVIWIERRSSKTY